MEMLIKGRKQNNNRRFPGIKGRRSDRKEKRQITAEVNLERWSAMTTEQKLADLDKRLGKGLGAKKQRARLAVQSKKQVSQKSPRAVGA